MPVRELTASGYRSLRGLRMPLARATVVVGPNGCGKTNVYRTLYLLGRAAAGELARALAEEGGMPSALWAGERAKKESARVEIGVELEVLSYSIACGLPNLMGFGVPTVFTLDPLVKEERVAARAPRKVVLLERGGPSTWVRDENGARVRYPVALSEAESVLAQLAEPHRYPELSALRQELLAWRFYHHFRTDPDAPLRHPRIGVRTPVLSHDGADLAAALQTIVEIGDDEALREAIATAFPGSALRILSADARFSVELTMPGLRRPLAARELSDGTLRYLCLVAALLSPHPPPLLALNEPETSLHPELLAPLARSIARAAERSQVLVTTHAEPLARALEASGASIVRLRLARGETTIEEEAESPDA